MKALLLLCAFGSAVAQHAKGNHFQSAQCPSNNDPGFLSGVIVTVLLIVLGQLIVHCVRRKYAPRQVPVVQQPTIVNAETQVPQQYNGFQMVPYVPLNPMQSQPYQVVQRVQPQRTHQFVFAPQYPLSNSRDESFWQWVRNQYALNHTRIYMNTGGLGPATIDALNTQVSIQAQLQGISDPGHQYIDDSRAPVAAFMGAKASELCFTRNSTEGTSIVAAGLGLQAGDEVIIDSHAHPGGAFPWMNLWLQKGVVVKIYEPSNQSQQANLDLMKALITSKTKVIHVDYISAPTGIVFPVKEVAALAHQYGIWCHVDAAQAVGQLPIQFDELGVDSLACSCHKWLGAPHGTGVLLIAESKLNCVVPPEIGAYCNGPFNLPNEFSYAPTAVRYEYGTRDASRVAATLTAVNFMNSIGMEVVQQRVKELATYLQMRLRSVPGVIVLTPTDPSMYNGMVTYKTDTVNFEDLFGYLLGVLHIRTRPVTERGLEALRISTHIFNFFSDCDLVVEGTIQAMQKQALMGQEAFHKMYGVKAQHEN